MEYFFDDSMLPSKGKFPSEWNKILFNEEFLSGLYKREKNTIEFRNDLFQLGKALLKKDEYLEQREEELKRREIEHEVRVQREVEKMREELLSLNEFTGSRILNPFGSLKILVIGESHLASKQLYKIFNESFKKWHCHELPKNSFEAPVLEFEKMRSFDVSNKVTGDKYDFIISGPRPHSMVNFNLKEGMTTLGKRLGLKAEIFEFTDQKLNKSTIKKLAEEIARKWGN